MKKKTIACLAASILMALAGCASQSAPSMTLEQANASVAAGYNLAAGDRVKVTVFDEPSLSGEFDIGLDGELVMPLISGVEVTGMSTDRLASIISTKLVEGGYVLEPIVSVEILSHRPFYILGEVKQPGEYPVVGMLTLDQAIAKAGGYTPRASKGHVILKRISWEKGRRIDVDPGSSLKIAPGDTISVPEAFF
ncbi:MAG: polysaccharide biosynthesis/export family protein [Caenibius sp.]